MRIILCDDDPAPLAQLQSYLLEYFASNRLDPPVLCAYTQVSQLLAAESHPAVPPAALAFLDVEMPETNGISLGARLAAQNPYLKIFIVTSYPDYLDDAMKFHVFRYLSKPVDKNRLFRNLKDALYQLSVDTRPVLLETPTESLTLLSHEILLVEAQGRRPVVRTATGLYQSTQTMRHWEETLLGIGSFYQPHRSFLINMKYVRRFSANLITLCAPDGAEYAAYLTRRKCKDFKNTYMLYVEAMR
ncbi:LytR/AlgR family response regulator transcription factor [Acutalibacter caecimuris]|uniref:LytR/AlgR family response regulator transcription factor n=1 Tax=Acutalibacter caecimuris TaxID=3093657 RepID=UPI002AC9EDC7|nr:LytTR family DNA-binding domain-containing protein [Acutalibacter sp. M00118]